MKYLLLIAVLLTGCTTYEYMGAVEATEVPIMCKVEGLHGRKYSALLFKVDSSGESIKEFNLSNMEKPFFIHNVPSTGVDVTIVIYDENGDLVQYSESKIVPPVVPYYAGEVDKADTVYNRGIPIVHPYVIGGDVVYTLAPLKDH